MHTTNAVRPAKSKYDATYHFPDLMDHKALPLDQQLKEFHAAVLELGARPERNDVPARRGVI